MRAGWVIVSGVASGFALAAMMGAARSTAARSDGAATSAAQGGTRAGDSEATLPSHPRPRGPDEGRLADDMGAMAGHVGAKAALGSVSAQHGEERDEDEAHRLELERAIALAELEARDAAWASSMEQALVVSFDEAVSVAPIAVGAPDCRKESCLVAVEWPDRDTAVELGPNVLTALPGQCTRTLTTFEEDEDDLDAYRTTVLLKCPRAVE